MYSYLFLVLWDDWLLFTFEKRIPFMRQGASVIKPRLQTGYAFWELSLFLSACTVNTKSTNGHGLVNIIFIVFFCLVIHLRSILLKNKCHNDNHLITLWFVYLSYNKRDIGTLKKETHSTLEITYLRGYKQTFHNKSFRSALLPNFPPYTFVLSYTICLC